MYAVFPDIGHQDNRPDILHWIGGRLNNTIPAYVWVGTGEIYFTKCRATDSSIIILILEMLF